MAIIYPNEEIEGLDRDLIKKTIDPVDLKIGVKRLKKVSRGGVLIEVPTQDEYDKLELEVQSNLVLKDKFKIRKAEKIKPEIIVYGLDDTIPNEEVIQRLESQNDALKEAEMKVEFRMKTKNGMNTIISINAEAFRKIIKIERVNLGWERFRIKEVLRPLQCYKCQMYGHLAKYCRNKQKCSNCGDEEHIFKECNNSLCGLPLLI